MKGVAKMFIILKDVLIVFKEKQENKLRGSIRYPMVYDDPGITVSQRRRHSQCRAPRRGADSFSYRGEDNICKMLDTLR